MNNVINVIAFVAITLSSSLFLSAQAAENNYKQGYISDELFIYMHAGPGTNYRILGTIIAGSEVKITGAEDNGYSEVIDDKNRATWVESKYVSTEPGLRFAVTELNAKIANSSDFTSQLDGEVNELNSKVNLLTNDKKKLSAELKKMTTTLAETQSQIKDQDTNIKKQWFFTGALVLGIGLILGLILPRLFARRRGTMDSWS
ncbi:TIGR04211 family SH3 domain-containing protein [Colwellia sp. 12G3]|uniref:TIGR04211 family SH3 domain-containing protein n=1 Tax=Colwellia sp. 12G3 TaxID=2058299 RepID=UPI000C31F90C|nr:TIGR04211 family SH3 domain-containing protein [Colwellia sp. 12G3]PKI12852.1 TIGR04211 family SH3 domain-containing protein [Colwellia sp. 12G3]